jgi:hypothetical protein
MSIRDFIHQNPSPQQVEDFIEQEARRRIAEERKKAEEAQ